ncbi:MAG: YidC/Oxa1 family membrane protein insertase [Oscillospiraceae bacterium]|nr:YidC/Oxa1 family membrane protein insertase [Oscillospiraceae bacterium]
MEFIKVPFAWLLENLSQLTGNLGWALIIFAVLVKLVLFFPTAKSKKSSMKMSRLTPRMQEIQKKYANDQQKQSEAIRELYKEEGVSMGGGCLWSLLPLLIMLPLYRVVIDFLAKTDINAVFLGINLVETPPYNVFSASFWNWPSIGAFLLPVLSAGSSVVSMLLSQKMNNSVITNEKGVQDKEAAKNSQSNQTGKVMMYMMPIMSLVIGFSWSAALSLYWFIQGVVSTIIDVFLTTKYRKIYDAEDAERLKKHMAEEAIEAEKERVRAERRANNPDGITQNTSKKKLQQSKQKEEEAAKAAAAKEYAAKKGIVIEEAPEKTTLSGISERPYCKGRAYDPNRYSNTEE